MLHSICSSVLCPLGSLSIEVVYFKRFFRCNRMILSKCDSWRERSLVLLCLKASKTMML